jgi:3-phenylpropionate/trans-cinnamate dioxygenase ferredoxin reductase subunit
MSEPNDIVVVGGGLAGAKAVEALRAEGFEGTLTLFAAEAHRPYERPPLSKGYLQGSAGLDKVFVHDEGWYAEHDVDLRVGDPVSGLDLRDRDVRADGGSVRYDALLLATGAQPRRIHVPGADLDGVHYLRTLDDSDRLRAAFTEGARVVVVGGGWIGLEAAAAARAAGCEVTVLEVDRLPLLRVLGDEMAAMFADVHRVNGVDLRTGAGVSAFRSRPDDPSRVGAVEIAGGDTLSADVVVVGVGVAPDVELAQQAGLSVDDGILVDASLRTSDPHVWAAGDVANADHPVLGRRLRVEHWANALNQPAVAAASMLGRDAVYDRLPYFYTDQFELGMEYTGWADPRECQCIVRGDVGSRELIAFWVKDGRVQAGMNVNVWDVTDDIKALIGSGRVIDPARLADPAVALADIAG